MSPEDMSVGRENKPWLEVGPGVMLEGAWQRSAGCRPGLWELPQGWVFCT